MKYDMAKPCASCPFRADGKGVKLTPARIREIAATCRHDGASFQCHSTVDYDGESESDGREVGARHCAGALIFAESNGGPHQMTRIVERFGLYDARALMKHATEVWPNLKAWLAGGALPSRKRSAAAVKP